MAKVNVGKKVGVKNIAMELFHILSELQNLERENLSLLFFYKEYDLIIRGYIIIYKVMITTWLKKMHLVYGYIK